MNTALVTGGSGFVGARLQTTLTQSGVTARGLVRRVSTDVASLVGDLLDISSLCPACEGMESIFHCAGYAHAFMSSNPDAHRRINFEGTRNLLAAAGEAGVRRFVLLSSVKAMAEPGNACADEDWPGEPATPYGRAKRAAAEAVLEAGAKCGMRVVNLRLAMVYGRGGRVMHAGDLFTCPPALVIDRTRRWHLQWHRPARRNHLRQSKKRYL